jgi:Putative zinc-finger
MEGENRIMSCETALERLPWLLNGTLEPEERKAVLEHLAGCDGCRAALADTRFAWQVFAEHLPVADLIAAAAGEPTATPRELFESHLAECTQCAADLETARSSRLLLQHEEVAVLRPAPPARWRNAALAASLAGIVAATGWVHSSREMRSLEARLETPPPVAAAPTPPAPVPVASERLAAENRRLQAENQRLLTEQAAEPTPPRETGRPIAEVNTLVQDVYPESAVRGGTQAENRIAMPASARLATLILHPETEAAAGPQQIEIADRQGKVVWKQGGLVRSASNDYTLTVDRGLLPAGTYVLRLYSADRKLLESFPLVLS